MKLNKKSLKIGVICVAIGALTTGCVDLGDFIRGGSSSSSSSSSTGGNSGTNAHPNGTGTSGSSNLESIYGIDEDKIEEINDLIESEFYFDTDEEEIAENVYKGILSGLDDPYSVYYTKEEYAQLQEDTSGAYVGIGVQVSQDAETNIITVVRVFKDSPAAEAGMLPGDIVVAVEDLEISDEELSEIVKLIKGEEGTSVNLTVYRESISDYVEITATRRKVENATVEYEMLDNQIGYIIVTDFYDVTAEQYEIALKDLEAQGMKGLIVDLRDNPGGLLSAVTEMLDMMLPEGAIVYTEDKNGNRDSEYTSSDREQFTKPLVVLINGNSASASEIFAGAIKDYGIGTLVGTKTYGKGIVQRLYELEDGSAIKLTISKYFTPNGNDIHGEGITPDIEIDLPSELKTQIEISHEEDVQLQKAIEVIESELAQ